MSQLAKRLMVAAWGIPLLIGIILAGGWVFAFAIAVIAVLSQWEFYKLGKVQGTPVWIALTAGALIPFAGHLFGLTGMIYTILIAAVVIVLYLPSMKMEGIQGKFGITMAGIVYPAMFVSFLVLIRDGGWGSRFAGTMVMFYLMSCIWICDTAAYFGGVRFGKHKMAPVVSPKKTWEGAVFGLAGGLLYGVIAGIVLSRVFTMTEAVGLATIVGTVGQIGDLSESCFKRSAGVKDSSALFGPHGGMFDRFDSLTAAAPAFYLFLKLMGRV